MSEKTPAVITGEIVALLEPLKSEERLRIMQASLVLLGEGSSAIPIGGAEPTKFGATKQGQQSDLPNRAQIWAKQNGISSDEIDQAFHITGSDVSVIAAEVPGKSVAEKTINAYLLTGLRKMLSGGGFDFDDKSARALCETSGCYDNSNHSAYLSKQKGNFLSGSKEKGWELTGPGQKRAAALVKEIASGAIK